jgi:hypothetical protein
MKLDREWLAHEAFTHRLRRLYDLDALHHVPGAGRPFWARHAILDRARRRAPSTVHRARSFVPAEYLHELSFLRVHYINLLSRIFAGMEHAAVLQDHFEILRHLNPFDGYYRDHVLHQFVVALMADGMLTNDLEGPIWGSPAGGDLAAWIADTWLNSKEAAMWRDFLSSLDLAPKDITGGDIRFAAALASLLHDFGYLSHAVKEHYCASSQCLPFVENPMPLCSARIGRMLRSSLISEYLGIILHRADAPAEDFLESRAVPWIKEALRKTHGAAGSLALLDFMEETYRNRELNGKLLFLFNWAALAILRHDLIDNMEGPEKCGTPFTADPLSFILILADNIHEFERKKLVAAVSPAGSTIVKSQVACRGVELRRRASTLEVRFLFSRNRNSARRYALDKARRIFDIAIRHDAATGRSSGWASPSGLFDRISFS